MDFLTDTQKKILSWSITGISFLVLIVVLGIVGFGLFAVLRELQDVFIPLAIAGVLAYIFHPVVNLIEFRFRISRSYAILVLMGLSALILGGFLFWIFPKVYEQGGRLVTEFPSKVIAWKGFFVQSLQEYPEVQKKIDEYQSLLLAKWPEWSRDFLSYSWSGLSGTLGLVLGFLFIPLYIFYFLRDQSVIELNWKRYIPLHSSLWKEELAFILSEVNRYLIVFFRGQVLVALSLGLLTSIGLLMIGLSYGLFLGLLTGILSIVPYLGIVIGLTVSCLIAFVQPEGGWGLVMGVIAVFGVIQVLEGFWISPKIMGDRTGLHPMTIIIAILVWSHLLGGIVGAILAIPLTATLRVLMFRYIWRE
jgi:predicted PurR-regulated permease PerM